MLMPIGNNTYIDFAIILWGAIACGFCIGVGLFTKSPLALMLEQMRISEKNIIQAIHDIRRID